MPAFFQTRDIKPETLRGGAPKSLRHVTSDTVRPGAFNLDVRKANPDAIARSKPTKAGQGGRMFSSQLREIEENRNRLRVAAQKKAVAAQVQEQKRKPGRPKKG